MISYWFYLAGSVCFGVGTGIVLFNHTFNEAIETAIKNVTGGRDG